MNVLLLVPALLVLAAAALHGWQRRDSRRANRVWRDLARGARASPPRFDPSMLDGLPEPARRFFEFAIRPGAALHAVAEIRMSGEIGLGTKEAPNYVPMRGHEILAPPQGLVWRFSGGRGLMRIAGSDGFEGGTSWVRFWLFGVVPVVRAGGSADHARAAFGRVVSESVFWVPAAFLPHNGVTWENVADDTARATVTHRDLTQTVDVTVDAQGRPLRVVIPRWSDANPSRTYQVQPFGGDLFDFREVDGFMLPTRVEGGNFIGTEDYFPFYKVVVEHIRFGGTA